MTPKQAVLRAIEQKRRIPELEPVILGDPHAACFYAMKVVKGEWEQAEKLIAESVLHLVLCGFDGLDVPQVHYERPKAEYVLKNRSQNLFISYATLVRKRCTHIERRLSSERYSFYGYKYAKLIYKLTGEITDFNDPRICVSFIKDITARKFANKLKGHDRLELCNDLHRRMVLHSFSRGESRSVKDYFAQKKKSVNEFLVMLSQHDENMSVRDLIKKLVSS